MWIWPERPNIESKNGGMRFSCHLSILKNTNFPRMILYSEITFLLNKSTIHARGAFAPLVSRGFIPILIKKYIIVKFMPYCQDKIGLDF